MRSKLYHMWNFNNCFEIFTEAQISEPLHSLPLLGERGGEVHGGGAQQLPVLRKAEPVCVSLSETISFLLSIPTNCHLSSYHQSILYHTLDLLMLPARPKETGMGTG